MHQHDDAALAPDGELLDPNPFGPDSPCFGCGPTHPFGLHLAFARRADVITTRFLPRGDLQGPPGVMHGGLVMTVADELGAWTVLGLLERFGFTAAFEGRLREPMRVGVAARGEGTLADGASPESVKDARIVKVDVKLHQEERLVFSGKYTFALMDEAGAERLLRGPLPDTWRRFARRP